MLLGVSLIVGLVYNSPFKRFFRLLRRKKEIPPKLQAVCKKRLFGMPLINSLIVTMPNIVVIIYSLDFPGLGSQFDEEVEQKYVYPASLPDHSGHPSGISLCLLLAEAPGSYQVYRSYLLRS